MAIDCTKYNLVSVADTCSIWNILSSKRLASAAKAANCSFPITTFVCYEALYKKRSNPTDADLALQKRLVFEKEKGFFREVSLSIQDLQDIDIMERRMRLGKGELSAIAYAKKIGQAFLTDDQKARRLGGAVLGLQSVQTTPHLFGWLFFRGHLSDGDVSVITTQHKKNGGSLSMYFELMYQEALRCRHVLSVPRSEH